MFDSIAQQMKEHLLPGHELAIVGKKVSQKSASILSPKHKEDIALDCTVQKLRGSDYTGLISQVSYRFLARVPASLEDVFRYVEALNSLLRHSQVFVVRDLDGDGSYYLRMDTLITGEINRTRVYTFLDNITEDVRIILKYFDHPLPQRTSAHRKTESSLVDNALWLKNFLSKCG